MMSADRDAQAPRSLGTPPGRPTQERMVRRLLEVYRRTQNSTEQLLHRIGFDGGFEAFLKDELPALSEKELWKVCSQISVELANAEARTAGRSPFRSSDWRLLFYCLLGSRTLREAILRLEDLFDSVDGRFGTVVQRARGRQVVLEFSGARGPDGEAAFVVLLNGLAMFHNLLSWVIDQPLGTVAEFAFPEQMRHFADRDLLPFDLVLDCRHSALIFDSSLLLAPIVRDMEDIDRLPTLNPAMEMARDEATDLPDRVRRLLLGRLERQRSLPSLETCSMMFGMSAETVRRRMRDRGVSFRTLRDDVRRSVAVKLLVDPRLSIEDVAIRLDFCDSDSLRLATQKWVGMAPSEYRKFLMQK